MSKTKTKLLASAASEQEIKKLIARFWYTNADKIHLEPQLETGFTYEVFQNNKSMFGFRVRCVKNRYRFEYLMGA